MISDYTYFKAGPCNILRRNNTLTNEKFNSQAIINITVGVNTLRCFAAAAVLGLV